MNDATSHLAKSYARLGLGTDPELVARRNAGITSAVESLGTEDLPDLMVGLFGIGQSAAAAYLTAFEDDPSFDVRGGDQEAVLLACAIAERALHDEDMSGPTALAVRTTSCGGLRPIAIDTNLLERADEALALAQGEEASLPSRRNRSSTPAKLESAIEAVGEVAANQFAGLQTAMTVALNELKGYVSIASQADVSGHNKLRAHIERLERETRTHWWVTGGWSALADRPFADLELAKAIIFCALELHEQHDSSLGLHAAPALLKLMLDCKRNTLEPLTISRFATDTELAWRKERFAALSTGENIGLYPLTAALALAADADDEEDWIAAFRRKVGLDADQELEALHLAVQLYHETLLRGLLSN